VSKTIALRTELQRLFKTLTTNVYYEKASDKTAWPRIVYEHNEVTKDSGRIMMSLEVNVLDFGTSTTAADTLADSIQTILDKYFYMGIDVEFAVYQGLRQNVEEDDERIIRRRLTFEIQLHEMKGES